MVAEEVRSLAQRSTDAARNSASLIEECMAAARGGVDLSGAAMENLREVADRAERVLSTISGIREGSQQQEVAVKQISMAVSQMNQATQVTAANAEQSADAAQALSDQSAEMLATVGAFATGAPAAGSDDGPEREQTAA